MNAITPKNSSVVRLGILQAGRAPDEMMDTYTDYDQLFIDLLGESEFEYLHWPVLDGEFPDSIDAADAWLITGSRFGAYEDHDWIPPLEEFILAVYESGNPMVGICFGHQIIAQALGGKVAKFEAGWSVGRVEYTLDESVFGAATSSAVNLSKTDTPDGTDAQPAESASEQIALMAFHQDQVIEAPASATTVGSTPFCQHAALLYGNRMLTIQPHPEFDKHFVDGLLRARAGILPTQIKENAERTLNLPLSRDTVAETMRRFLKREHC